MIISATMLDGMAYEIDTINNKLNINIKDNQPVRILRLSDDNNNISAYLAGTYETNKEAALAVSFLCCKIREKKIGIVIKHEISLMKNNIL